MKFVVPLRIQAVSADSAGLDHANVVHVAFGDQPGLPPQSRCLLVKSLAQLRQNMDRTVVINVVNRVQPECVDVIFAEPIESIVYDEAPDAIASGPVEVDSRPPRRSIVIREIGAELGQIVPLRPDVIVDHVQHDGESGAMAGVH